MTGVENNEDDNEGNHYKDNNREDQYYQYRAEGDGNGKALCRLRNNPISSVRRK